VDTVLSRFRLPVSGREVALRPPSGAEDLLLLEAPRRASGDVTLALSLAERVARTNDSGALDWTAVCVSDLDTLVLRLRQALIGDRIRADVSCTASGCGRRIDIEFGIDQFLAHHAPRTGGKRGSMCEPADEQGWFRLIGSQELIHFRLPTVADQLAVIGHPEAASELAQRCLRPADVAARLRRRVEAAMETLAPSLSGDLEGVCPECEATVTVYFDARWFCLRELRQRAAFVYQDVDILARRYHWSETEILALPPVRRTAYAELARSG
jgi:hypothetical protein